MHIGHDLHDDSVEPIQSGQQVDNLAFELSTSSKVEKLPVMLIKQWFEYTHKMDVVAVIWYTVVEWMCTHSYQLRRAHAGHILHPGHK